MDMAKPGLYPMALAALMVMGCGGGGGGGNDGASTQNQTVQTSTPLTLDTSGLADQKVALREESDFSVTMETYSVVSSIVVLFEDIESSLSAQSTDAGAVACANPEGGVTYSESGDQARGSYQYSFDNCRVDTSSYGTYVLNGIQSGSYTVSSTGSEIDITLQFDLSGQQLNSEGESRDFKVYGSLVNESDYRSETQVDVSVYWPALEVIVGDDYFALRDSYYDYLEIDGQIWLAWNADVISSVQGGSLSFTTPSTLIRGEGESCPSDGHLMLEGDGTLEIRYGASSGRGVGVEVLLNGSEVAYVDSCSSYLPF
ncbi:hypothetical protein LPB19_09505 [Marinobacter salinisoli]|uniref:Lipoprotein n=1 Tax=Marinobacter salinisoli TaxID=2769486 RepID=A0ABX7MMS3_9GAMM|nr:hypothetical protein [Marinobacter salinisoli]QSP93463.1 hypothetical protein LPB19_09505 [Marinobacter salinisoli]